MSEGGYGEMVKGKKGHKNPEMNMIDGNTKYPGRDEKGAIDLKRENGPDNTTDMKPSEIYTKGIAHAGDAEHSHSVPAHSKKSEHPTAK